MCWPDPGVILEVHSQNDRAASNKTTRCLFSYDWLCSELENGYSAVDSHWYPTSSGEDSCRSSSGMLVFNKTSLSVDFFRFTDSQLKLNFNDTSKVQSHSCLTKFKLLSPSDSNLQPLFDSNSVTPHSSMVNRLC